MFRLFTLAACAALFLLTSPAWANAEPPQFFLKPDGTVEQRVAAVESDLAKLQKEVAAMKAELRGEPVAAAVPPKSSAPAKVRYSVCVGGKCTIYEVDAGTPIPPGATLLSGSSASAAGSPCPTGPCGDSCGCAGVSAAPASSGGERRRLFGRVRGGRACSSCGQ